MKTLCTAVFLLWTCLAAAATDGLKLDRKEDGLLYYAGQVRLTGTYELRFYDPWPEATGDSVCFRADDKSAPLVPRQAGDERGPFFCFSNSDKARKAFSLPGTNVGSACGYSGKAEVVIGEYVANPAVSDVLDFAQLVRVIKAERPQALKACK